MYKEVTSNDTIISSSLMKTFLMHFNNLLEFLALLFLSLKFLFLSLSFQDACYIFVNIVKQ